MSHHTFAEGQLFPIHHQLWVGTHSCCMGMTFTCHIHVTVRTCSTAASHAKDGQHETPMLGDHTHLTTADTTIIIQSYKGGVLSYYFWAANTQKSGVTKAAPIRLAQRTH